MTSTEQAGRGQGGMQQGCSWRLAACWSRCRVCFTAPGSGSRACCAHRNAPKPIAVQADGQANEVRAGNAVSVGLKQRDCCLQTQMAGSSSGGGEGGGGRRTGRCWCDQRPLAVRQGGGGAVLRGGTHRIVHSQLRQREPLQRAQHEAQLGAPTVDGAGVAQQASGAGA